MEHLSHTFHKLKPCWELYQDRINTVSRSLLKLEGWNGR
jgi:hypothetical protein